MRQTSRNLVLWTLALLLLSACEKKWVPTGSWQKPVTPDCDLRNIESQLLRSGHNPQLQTQIIEGYVSHCKPEIVEHKASKLQQLLQMGSIFYAYHELPYVKDIAIPEAGGYTLRGRLALHPSTRPLPLLIVKCGMQCDLDDSSLSYVVTMFFDESPFHLLVLPSTSGREYQMDNKVVTIGGFLEGQQLFHAAQYVQSPAFPYRSQISAVHAAGFSLGGHALLYAALIGGYVRKPNGAPYIQSYLAACPVVDLKGSVSSLYRKPLLGSVARRSFWSQMRSIWNSIPKLPEIITPGMNHNDPEMISEVIASASIERYQTAANLPEPLRNFPVRNKDEFWQANDFRNFAPLLREHVLIWTSADDPVVSARDNTLSLLQSLPESPYLHAAISSNGTHCGFGAAYGWRTASTIMRSILLSHMPELLAKRRVRHERVNFNAPYELPTDRHLEAVKWEAGRNIPYAKLTSSVFKKGCHSKSCAEPINTFTPLSGFGQSTPRSLAEAQMLTRWMNGNIWLSGPDGRNLDPNHAPEWADWAEY